MVVNIARVESRLKEAREDFHRKYEQVRREGVSLSQTLGTFEISPCCSIESDGEGGCTYAF